MDEQTAIHLYWRLIGDNKTFFMIVGFLASFCAVFLHCAVADDKISGSGRSMELKILYRNPTEPIHLITELKPIEIRLNEIKATLKRQELEAVGEAKRRKNDLVLFLAHDLKTPLTSIVAYLTMLDRSSRHAGRRTEKHILTSHWKNPSD